jgi:phosphonate transport system ATP-binding protein
MSTLKVENVSKYYGDVTALEDISFEIEDEFVVLLGRSGAGKSTLLRCVNGLTGPTEGAIYLNDEEVTGSRADIGMIFQQHNLVEGVSAYLNSLTGSLSRVSMLRSALQWQSHEDKLRALEALETVGLLEEGHQKVAQMSGGQQQRVGIARALVQDPQLLLADEPVASLDPSSAETVMQYLRKAAMEHDVTALVSLHQVNVAAHFGDRFIGLRDGQKLFDVGRGELTPGLIDDLYGSVETVSLATQASAKGNGVAANGQDDEAEPTDVEQEIEA